MSELDATSFLLRIDALCDRQHDRAIALLWFAGRDDNTLGCTAKEIGSTLRAAGHAEQNVSRMASNLAGDRRTAAAKNGGWALRPAARRELDAIYRPYVGPASLPTSDAVVPMALLAGTRGYIEKVGDQINKSFDGQLYDCCAVMCRRLLETLIIEVFEKSGKDDQIRNGRHFIGLSDMIVCLEKEATIYLSKPAMNALKSLKNLGDLSAHNRHYNARIGDLEPHRAGIRLVVEELLYRSELHPTHAKAA